MKTLGMIGGTGWISTVEYYRLINQQVNQRLGGLQFARCILYSLNYGDIDAFNRQNKPDQIFLMVRDAAVRLIMAGADSLILCANTMHRFAVDLEKLITVPLIHIATAAAHEISQRHITCIGLLGTKQTMELDFYKTKLGEAGITTIIPEADDRDFIQNAIETELLKGIFLGETKMRFLSIFNDLKRQGVGGVVLGCTEIPLIISQDDTDIPVFDTLKIHTAAAVDFILSDKE
jgi:aspartate racemase